MPPQRGGNIKDLYGSLEVLLDFKPAFIDVTYHQQETVETEAGKKIRIALSPGTVAISSAIKYKYNVETVPHLICSGFTKEETEEALIELNYVDIDNVLAIRGDPKTGEKVFQQTNGGHKYASELVKQIADLRTGNYITPVKHKTPIDFCIGVAGYPEKHSESPNLEEDLLHLKEKMNAGADYVVAQMFFDNKKYVEFVNNARTAGIDAPIIPGLKPISTYEQINKLPAFFHLTIPQDLMKELKKYKDDHKKVREIGTEWTIHQCQELKKLNVPSLHFYVMNNPKQIKSVLEKVM